MIIVDSNVLAARNLTGTNSMVAEQVEQKDPVWIVPPLWRYEFQNILAKVTGARQITIKDAIFVWKKVSKQLTANEHEPNPEMVIYLSDRYKITAYDANFIAVAMEMDLMFVTEDGELQRKFPALAMGMKTFISMGNSTSEARESRAPYGTRKRK